MTVRDRSCSFRDNVAKKAVMVPLRRRSSVHDSSQARDRNSFCLILPQFASICTGNHREARTGMRAGLQLSDTIALEVANVNGIEIGAQ